MTACSASLPGSERRAPPSDSGSGQRGKVRQPDFDADVARQYWFAGDSYIGSAKAGEALAWTPDRAGQWTLSVVDDHGRHDSRQVDVTVER